MKPMVVEYLVLVELLGLRVVRVLEGVVQYEL